MKTHQHILLTLFTLLNSLVVFPQTNPTDSTQVNQKTVTKTVHTDLAHLEEAVRKLSVQNSSSLVGNSSYRFRSFPSLATYTTNTLGGSKHDLAEFNTVNLEK